MLCHAYTLLIFLASPKKREIVKTPSKNIFKTIRMIKSNLLFFFILAINMSTNAQIGEVKVVGNLAKIYDDKARYTNYYVSIPSRGELLGYNANYIVVKDGNLAKIYDAKGHYTNKYVSLCTSCTVKNVSASAILVKEGRLVKYYDFNGHYTNQYTND
jgi:hypothetical protein